MRKDWIGIVFITFALPACRAAGWAEDGVISGRSAAEMTVAPKPAARKAPNKPTDSLLVKLVKNVKDLTGGAEPAKQPATVAPVPPPSPRLVKVAPGTHKAHPVKRQPPKPALTRQDLASIPLGTKRLEVLRRFGAPASKISMPEEGGLVEVYHYAIGPDETADIRLINGSVTAVPAALTAAGTN